MSLVSPAEVEVQGIDLALSADALSIELPLFELCCTGLCIKKTNNTLWIIVEILEHFDAEFVGALLHEEKECLEDGRTL